MIRGINPLHITCIVWKPYRRYGYHPLYLRLALKRSLWHGWLAKTFGNGRGNHYTPDDHIRMPTVIIEGQHRDLKRIVCRSNDEAHQLWTALNDELDNFYGELAVLEKLREGL
jgi:hypothetical protein